MRDAQPIPGLSCTRPDGAFYNYVSCAGWIGRRTPGGAQLATDADVGAYLLESGVAVPEGAGYGLSPYFRVSFATSLEKLKEAADGRGGAEAGLMPDAFRCYAVGIDGRFLRYEFLIAILPSRKVNTSHPFTSTRLPSTRVPVNVHSDTPRSPQTKCRGECH